MPRRIHVVRHAQGEHNVAHDFSIRDPRITALGKTQCAHLRSTFALHAKIDAIFCSPLRRTIQTAVYSFRPILARQDKHVPFILLPLLQEITAMKSDVGIADTEDDIRELLPGLFDGEEVGFDVGRIDASMVTEGWNRKDEGYWAYERERLLKRGADLREWLFGRGEGEILLITHGAIAHFITEDWDVEDAMLGTSYNNCEHREFVFTQNSRAGHVHLVETEESRGKRMMESDESKRKRGFKQVESDPQVLDEARTAKNPGASIGPVETVTVAAD